MKMTEPTDTYATKDLWLSAALLAAGARLLHLDWRTGRAYFIFADPRRCEVLSDAYWRGDLTVRAKAFSDGLRTLKDRLFGDRGNGNGDAATRRTI